MIGVELVCFLCDVEGVVVFNVVEDSLVEVAGLRGMVFDNCGNIVLGDVIVVVNEDFIVINSDFYLVFEKYCVGEEVIVSV